MEVKHLIALAAALTAAEGCGPSEKELLQAHEDIQSAHRLIVEFKEMFDQVLAERFSDIEGLSTRWEQVGELGAKRITETQTGASSEWSAECNSESSIPQKCTVSHIFRNGQDAVKTSIEIESHQGDDGEYTGVRKTNGQDTQTEYRRSLNQCRVNKTLIESPEACKALRRAIVATQKATKAVLRQNHFVRPR